MPDKVPTRLVFVGRKGEIASPDRRCFDCRRGMVTPGYERDPQAVATGVLEAAARYLGLKGVPDPGIPIIPRG
jgi:hypothetical protein